MCNLIIVNSPFSIEASPPSLNADIYNIRYNLKNIYDKVDVLDLDSISYKYLKDDYDLIYYLLGGYPFSYPTNSFVPINVYPFEILPTGTLVLDVLLGIDFYDSLNLICRQLALDYKTTLIKFKKFLSFLDKQVEILRNYERTIFVSDSIVSCILSYYLAKKGRLGHIYGVGKNYFIPLLNDMLTTYERFENIFKDKYELFKYLNINDINQMNFDFSDVNIVNYEFGYGIGHILLKCGTGCPNKCKFCSIRLEWDKNDIYDELYEEPNDVISEKIDHIYDKFGITFIHLGMCTFNANIKKATQLLKILEQKKALFTANLTVRNLSNEFIHYMERAHFYKVIVGVESVNKDMLSIMNKGKNIDYNLYKADVLQMKAQFEKCNIISQMNVLLFYPGQSKVDIENVIDDWKRLFSELEHNGIITNNIPIGTLCLNYPSQMYKEVMENTNFKIFYHSATKEQKEKTENLTLIKYYEKIPIYTVNGSEICVENKMDYVKKLKNLENDDLETDISHFLNQVYSSIYDISTNWNQLRKKVILNDSLLRQNNFYKIEWLKNIDINNLYYTNIIKDLDEESETKLVLLLIYLIYKKECIIV